MQEGESWGEAGEKGKPPCQAKSWYPESQIQTPDPAHSHEASIDWHLSGALGEPRQPTHSTDRWDT